ncbi:NUDIX domain-containing protein [[Ruminococcus] lactaris]|jgi:8-oxo-dGTP diphosphatase|uniref:NUDIX hydrolase n=1 Tax=[Ruminococcus] lactaris TaxID=46228 RepID=A0A414P9I0_9FIRM|nr:NUDIX hydrolase [[Ruminococcus] lactaris]RHF62924.1 NUDIX hydrolase [[Ruminococcus] lactaris]
MPSFLDDISSFYGTGEKNEKGQTLEEFLKEYDPYQYKNPCATTDMVLFSYAGEKPDTDALKVLLVCRKNHPSIGYWALPGGFVELYENLEDTARRELEEETGVKGLPVEQFACYGDYQRDPRARVITTAYFSLVNEKEVRVKAGDDAADAAWFTVKLKKGESRDVTTDAAVIKKEDFSLELENEDRGLKIGAVICKEERQGLVRERKYKVKEGGMVAVDHAAIITQALEVIQQRIRKNSCTCG